MKHWYIKELSRLTQLSVQTLHHYDRIGLLEPSIRLGNGYRLYSEKDLSKLYQIISLKYLGIELSLIKEILADSSILLQSLTKQEDVLIDQLEKLQSANSMIVSMISDCRADKPINWKAITQSIEVTQMTKSFNDTWEGKAFDADILAQYAQFENELKTRFTAKELQQIESRWHDIIRDINANLQVDPTSEKGRALGNRTMEWVNNFYGKKYMGLRNAIWEKGFKEGYAIDEHGMSAESVDWLDQAMEAYLRERIYEVLSQVGLMISDEVQKAWQDVIEELYAENQTQIKEYIAALMQDKRVSDKAKEWLKALS